MKFGKWLKRQIEQSLREWREQFLRYKELKQFVNALLAGRTPTPEEAAAFFAALDAEIEKISSFFLDMEELFVIRHRQLKEEIERLVARRAAAMASGAPVEQQEAEAEAAAVRREVVYFHGDMVLLLNYSHINYIGLVKILKKYDKRTGAGLLLPAMASLQEQPFFRTETVSRMVRECEAMLEAVPVPAASRDAAREALAVAEESTFRYTVAALLIMQDVRAGSSTRGSHSLPPLDLPDSDWLRSFQPPSPIHIFQ